MGDSPWGSYAGMFRDKYGIEWIIEFSPSTFADIFIQPFSSL
jgi:PhnB protein